MDLLWKCRKTGLSVVSLPLDHSDSAALSTVPLSMPDVGVHVIEGVPFWALLFNRVTCWDGGSTQDIFPDSDGLQMGGVYTTTITAEVIQHLSRRHRPDEGFVHKSMSRDLLSMGASSYLELAVTELGYVAQPLPTPVRFNKHFPQISGYIR